MMSGKRGAKNRRNNSRESKDSQVISHPPQIRTYNIVHSQRMRFTVQGSLFNDDITFYDLLDTICFSTTAIQLYHVFSSVKVRAVEVWAAPVQGGAPNTVSVQFTGASAGAAGDQQLYTDTSMGIEPAHVFAHPNVKSQASQFQLSVVETAFHLVAPVGAVVDVELTFKQDFAAPLVAQNASVGAAVGAIYLRGLDGLAASTTKLPPALAANGFAA